MKNKQLLQTKKLFLEYRINIAISYLYNTFSVFKSLSLIAPEFFWKTLLISYLSLLYEYKRNYRKSI